MGRSQAPFLQEPSALCCRTHCGWTSFVNVANISHFPFPLSFTTSGFPTSIVFSLQTLLQFCYVVLSILSHVIRKFPLQFWLFWTNPIHPLHLTLCWREPYSESGLCWLWKGMEATWNASELNEELNEFWVKVLGGEIPTELE